jgi:hypothetical protein
VHHGAREQHISPSSMAKIVNPSREFVCQLSSTVELTEHESI